MKEFHGEEGTHSLLQRPPPGNHGDEVRWEAMVLTCWKPLQRIWPVNAIYICMYICIHTHQGDPLWCSSPSQPSSSPPSLQTPCAIDRSAGAAIPDRNALQLLPQRRGEHEPRQHGNLRAAIAAAKSPEMSRESVGKSKGKFQELIAIKNWPIIWVNIPLIVSVEKGEIWEPQTSQ